MKKIILIIFTLLLGTNVEAQLRNSVSCYNSGIDKMTQNNISKKSIESAIVDFEMAIKEDPNYGDAYLALGITLYQKSMPILKRVQDKKLEIYERANFTLELFEIWKYSIKALEKAKDYGKEDLTSKRVLMIMYRYLGMNDKYLKIKNEKEFDFLDKITKKT